MRSNPDLIGKCLPLVLNSLAANPATQTYDRFMAVFPIGVAGMCKTDENTLTLPKRLVACQVGRAPKTQGILESDI
jgi:hypothetical protein